MNLPITMLDRPRARRRDPITSHQAAEKAAKFANGHRERILEVMDFSGQSMTAEEIAYRTSLTVVQIDRRLPEMERAGLIEQTGQIVNGFRCWRLV